MQETRFAFGSFVLDPGAGTLLRDGDPVAIGYRGLRLLAALVERSGEILGKAELLDAAWPATAVEEGNLTVQIAQAQEAAWPRRRWQRVDLDDPARRLSLHRNHKDARCGKAARALLAG